MFCIQVLLVGILSVGQVGSNPNLSDKSQITDRPTSQVNPASDELNLLFLIHRHGDRAPIQFASKDPYKKNALDIWPTGLGMLTNSGKERMFKLGKYLRRRYANYLGISNPRQVYTRSSDVDRCIASAELVLAGLYPPVGDSIWNKDLLWQPIPINSTPKNRDNLLYMPYCPERDREFKIEIFTGNDLKRALSEEVEGVEELTEKLESEYGYRFRSLFDYYYAFSTLNIELDRKLPLPEWLTNNINTLNGMGYYSDLMRTKTDKLKRFISGVLVNDIVAKMTEYKRHQEGESGQRGHNYKLFHYSTHDIILTALLNTLGVYQGQVSEIPGFGSAILIELHRSKQQPEYSVKLFYLDETRDEDKSLRELTITDCIKEGENVCSLDMFTEYTKPYRLNPSDWQRECKFKSYSRQ